MHVPNLRNLCFCLRQKRVPLCFPFAFPPRVGPKGSSTFASTPRITRPCSFLVMASTSVCEGRSPMQVLLAGKSIWKEKFLG